MYNLSEALSNSFYGNSIEKDIGDEKLEQQRKENEEFQRIKELKKFKRKILDYGAIEVVDLLGSDACIKKSASISYGAGTKKSPEIEPTLNYMMEHYHSTPFQMCEIKFYVKCPIFVARQWMRHRSFSYNEESLRYTDASGVDFYLPELDRIQGQSETNKQSSSGIVIDKPQKAQNLIREAENHAINIYNELIELGVSREIARIVLPTASYTQFIVKGDLKNWLDFVTLRTGEGAQYEIRLYADAILEFIKMAFPITYNAFMKYRINSTTFSDEEMELLNLYFKSQYEEYATDENNHKELNERLEKLGKRRSKEFLQKVGKLK